jgi:signal transduction histidine kinase
MSQQLLTFSRRDVFRPQRLDMNEALSAVGDAVRAAVGDGVAVTMRLAGDLPATVADPAQLEHVLGAVAANASDAMPNGGTLLIQTDRYRPDAGERAAAELDADDYIRVRVIDDGIGMDASTAARAFEPFFSTKADGRVTGLGLTTALGIMQQAGGWLSLASEPGIGTTVTAWFPVAPS